MSCWNSSNSGLPSANSDSKYFISGVLLQVATVAELVSWSFGPLVAIAFVGVDGWRAFKKRKHWIPCDSFLLGALTLQLLTLVNMPSAVLNFPQDDKYLTYSVHNLVYCREIVSRRMLVLAGRISMFVLMGCMLPGVACPRSSTLSLWSDMAALIITSSAPILHLYHEIYVLSIAYFLPDYKLALSHDKYAILQLWTVTITVLVSFVILILVLASAALASITIHKIVSHKIPIILSRSTLQLNPVACSYSQFFWERVEEQVVKSWIVVCTSNPQYIIARSVLASSVALVITVCNGILVFEVLRTDFTVSIPMIFHWLVIVLGSTVIYWRWVTAVVFCPTSMGKKWASITKYFEIEDFWKRYLLELKDGHKTHREMGDSYLKILMLKMGRRVKFHKLVPLVVWLQIVLVVFSKACRFVSELLLSNKYSRKLLIGSGGTEFPDLYGGKRQHEIELGKFSYYDKYSKAFISMKGENAASLWVANRKSIEGIKRQMERGQEEGKTSEKLVALLKNKSCSAYKCVHLQNSVPLRLEVESEFDICQYSYKMRAVSIITIIIELYPFIHDVKRADGVIEACSQAWSIMDLVENSETEAFLASKAADKLFQDLQKRGKSFHYQLGMCNSLENSSEPARTAVNNLVEKAKKIAEEYRYKTWNEVVAGYSLWRLSANIDFENFMRVEGIMDELVRMLADVMESCMAKALDVIMEDSEKWATMAMEQRIWKAAYVAGKVKSITEKVGWTLTCKSKEAIKNSLASTTGIVTLRKYPTFQSG